MDKINKLSLDLHGVINDLPDVFKSITKSLIKDGWEVHILTGSTTKKAESELVELGLELGVHFTHVMGVPDYCLSQGFEVIGKNEKYGNPEFKAEDWFKAKSVYCAEHKIDLHMDDQLDYGKTFKNTAFARLYTKNLDVYEFNMFSELYGKKVMIFGEKLVWTKSEAIRNAGKYTPCEIK